MLAAPPRLMSIAENAFLPHDGPPHEARDIAAPGLLRCAADRRRATRLPVDPDGISLAEADFILSAGNGVTDWESFAELGQVLGATRGGSRVVCDEGHLPRDRQVGASGSLVTARCYLAFGISGAPQHLQGITEVKHVVAINTDLHAEMIKRADLAIIADAQERSCRALIRLCEGSGRRWLKVRGAALGRPASRIGASAARAARCAGAGTGAEPAGGGDPRRPCGRSRRSGACAIISAWGWSG